MKKSGSILVVGGGMVKTCLLVSTMTLGSALFAETVIIQKKSTYW